jgi:hypothetical protein
VSYLVIVLNSVFKWGISDIAITAWIVETPIEFIGRPYIIARNLFPQSSMLRQFQRAHPDAADHEGAKAQPKVVRGKRSSVKGAAND